MTILSALPPRFWRQAALRGFGFWFGIRAMLLMAASLGGSPPDPSLSPPAAILLIGAACAVAALHARAMRESVFLGNLGIGRAALLAPLPFSAAAELLTQIALAMAVQ